MRDKDRNQKGFIGRVADIIARDHYVPSFPEIPMHGPSAPGGPGRKPSGVAAAKRAKKKRQNIQARKSKRK